MTARKAVSIKDMNNLKIVNLGDGAAPQDAASKNQVDTAYAAALSRSNHTGTQLAATISDFTAQVRTSSLNQMAAPTADLSVNSHKLTGVLDPTGAQDAATKAYVDAQISGLVSGVSLKGAVRVAASSNITIASPGSTIDGVAMSAGDTVLLTGQTTASQNGPYTWNGAATPMTRATNWDTSGEAVLGSYWVVEMGSNADKFALLTNDVVVTLDTTALTFTFIGATQSWAGYSTTCPPVAAGGNWTVTHNKGSKLYNWSVYRTASPYDDVEVYGVRTDNNTLTITPDIAMASGEYTVVVL